MLAKWFGLEGKVALVVGASRGLGRDMTLEDWYRTFDTNLTGALFGLPRGWKGHEGKGGLFRNRPR